MSDPKWLFYRCRKCTSELRLAPLPVSIDDLARINATLRCGWCGADSSHLSPCCTEGTSSVSEPRVPPPQFRS